VGPFIKPKMKYFCFRTLCLFPILIRYGNLVVSLSHHEWMKTLDEDSAFFSNRHTIKELFETLWTKHNFLKPELFHLCTSWKFKQRIPPQSNLINFFFEMEHVLVTDGGKTIAPGTPKGNIATYDKNNAYLVRIECVECYKSADIVIDYSTLNIENIRVSGVYDDDFVRKSTYVPALPFKYDPFYGNHTGVGISTAFYRPGGRRSDMYNQIKRLEGDTGISNMYFENLPWFMSNLDSIKILLNVHQTDFDHTFEELRVLPALLRGVVVVSEWSPLHHLLPFKDYIIFERYDKLAEKVIEVKNNYESYRDKFFGPHSKLNETINRMRETAFENLERLVLERYNALNSSHSSME